MSQSSEDIARQFNNAAVNKKNWGAIAYNVLSEGLAGDGVTDDTAKLQALINKAIAEGRRTILFPHGQYYVTALTNASQVDFVGDNSTFVGGYSETIGDLGGFAELTTETVTGVYNVVTGYGALPSLGDNTSAIQAAIDDAALVRGEVYLPHGKYHVTSLNVPTGVTLRGAGWMITIIEGIDDNQDIFKLGNNYDNSGNLTYYVSMKSFAIVRANKPVVDRAAIYCSGMYNGYMEDIWLDKHYRALRLENKSGENNFENFMIRNCNYGLSQGLNSVMWPDCVDNTFSNFKCYNVTNIAYQVEGSFIGDTVFINPKAVVCGTGISLKQTGNVADYRDNILIINPVIDSCTGKGLYMDKMRACNVDGGWFGANASYGIHIFNSVRINLSEMQVSSSINADILLQESDFCGVDGANISSDIAIAVHLLGSKNNKISGCTITGFTSRGVLMSSGNSKNSTRNIITGNNVSGPSTTNAFREEDVNQDYNNISGNVASGGATIVAGPSSSRGANSIVANNVLAP